MKKTIFFSLAIFGLLAIILSCNSRIKNSDIINVSLSNQAARGGFTTITVSQDSIIKIKSHRVFDNPIKTAHKLTKKDWNFVFSDIDIKLLESTESGKSKHSFDGSNLVTTIVTKDKEYHIVNTPEEAKGYHNLEKLQNNIKSLEEKYIK